MILTCPECKARYVVDPKALMPAGRKVRCAKCRHDWFEDKPAGEIDSVPPQVDTKSEENEAPSETSQTENDENKDNNKTVNETDEPETDFDFPIQKPKKRQRPVPKGSNLPALQNHKYGSSKLGWILLICFIGAVVGSFLFLQNTIIDNWPASQKLYVALGLEGNSEPNKIEKPVIIPIDQRLKLGNLSTSIVIRNAQNTLILTGDITNISDKVQSIPKIKVMLKDASASIVREWTYTPEKLTVNTMETVPFETSLPNPPSEAKDVNVIFETN
ncbi:MAG: zinc-ribbon domain-containing protein [Proteobacteria bacterium]|jgi:predicted Zn finger-like uncharacterized protein|nr:zinc-ribbon domain-containing protein [Pseudomonadota bacterium]